MKSSRIKTALAVLLCAAACTWFVRSVLTKPAAPGPTTETSAQRKVRLDSITKTWESREYTTLTPEDPAIVEAAINATAGTSLDALTAIQSASLIRTLSEHIAARSDPTSASYLALVDRDPDTRWVRPTDDVWFNCDYWASKILERTLGEDLSPREGLAEAYRVSAEDYGARFDAIASGEGAMRFKVFRIRTVEQVIVSVLDDLDEEIKSYWYENSGANALMFRLPSESLESVLSRQQSVLMVEASMLVRTDGGEVMNFNTRWYWHESRRRWLCRMMARKGWLDAFLCY